MTENLIDTYYDVVMTEPNPGSNITKFYCSLFEQKFDVKLLKMFSKLVKIYGREIVFSSVIDMFYMDDVNLGNIFPLVRYFCNKKSNANLNTNRQVKDLSVILNDIIDRVSKVESFVYEEFPSE
jgi:hypothetical protein